MRFAEATAVTPDGAGRWSANVPDGWDIFGKANGGVLMAVGARAMAAAADRPDPLTVTAHYLSPGVAGPFTISTDVVKAGRRLSTVTALVSQGDRAAVQLIGAFGDLSTMEGPELITGVRPEFPPPDQCSATGGGNVFSPALNSQIDVRLVPDDTGFGHREPHGTACMRGWFRLLDNEPIDVFTLLLGVDCFPPAIFNTGLAAGWTPTVELTAHIRRRPVGEWLQCQVGSRYIFGGSLEEDVEIWDERGLVAQARQLALVPMGRPG
jgi:Thioesterase-like superfamily